MYNEPSEEAFGLSKEGLRAGEEERWRGGGEDLEDPERFFFLTVCFSMFFHVLLKWK